MYCYGNASPKTESRKLFVMILYCQKFTGYANERKASQNKGHSAVTRLDYRQSVSFTSFGVSKFELRTRPRVSGYFCIINFFYEDTKISATRSVYESYTTVHTYRIRIRTSQRISQQSSRGKKTGSDTVASAYTKIYGYEHPHVYGYTEDTEISTLWTLGVSA